MNYKDPRASWGIRAPNRSNRRVPFVSSQHGLLRLYSTYPASVDTIWLCRLQPVCGRESVASGHVPMTLIWPRQPSAISLAYSSDDALCIRSSDVTDIFPKPVSRRFVRDWLSPRTPSLVCVVRALALALAWSPGSWWRRWNRFPGCPFGLPWRDNPLLRSPSRLFALRLLCLARVGRFGRGRCGRILKALGLVRPCLRPGGIGMI